MELRSVSTQEKGDLREVPPETGVHTRIHCGTSTVPGAYVVFLIHWLY